MPRTVDPERLSTARAAANLLHRPGSSRHPADVARAICGAQAQDGYAGRLAFRARSVRLRAVDVDRARAEERSLVRTWAMRQTMHLIAADDHGWLVPLFEPAMLTTSRRRLGQLGMDEPTVERALRAIRRILENDGPLPREVLSERIKGKGVPLDSSTWLHVVRVAVASGMACLGPDQGRRTCLILERDWLGERPPHDRKAALRELARRYVGAFGPATEADFAGWAGLPLRDVRAGLEGIAGELREVRVGEGRAWTLKRARRRSRGRIVRLLPAWDTYLMGYRDRSFLAKPDEWRRIMPGGGILHPAIVVDGRAIGVWRLRRKGDAHSVQLDAFTNLDAATTEAIDAEIADVVRFESSSAHAGAAPLANGPIEE
jgi:hypothetical protein